MVEFKYFSEISLDKLSASVVIPCLDENGMRCILIKNASSKTLTSNYATDNLQIRLNTVVARKGAVYNVHILKVKKNDPLINDKFDVIYRYVFGKLREPASDTEISELVLSLEEFFTISPSKDKDKMQVGVFGELLCLLTLYENGYENIFDKYHINFYSKHDIDINEKIKLEVKTTLSEKRIHSFSHNQICRSEFDVFVCSVMLERALHGKSVYEIIEEAINKIGNIDTKFAMEKLMLLCDVDKEKQGLRFSIESAYRKIKFYNANNLPHLNIIDTLVPGVINIKYDVDCELAKPIEIDTLISIFKNADKRLIK